MFMMRDDVSGQLFEHLLCTVLRSDFAESFHDNAVLTSEGKSLGNRIRLFRVLFILISSVYLNDAVFIYRL